MKPTENTEPRNLLPETAGMASLTPEQREFAQVIGRPLAELWHQECHRAHEAAQVPTESTGAVDRLASCLTDGNPGIGDAPSRPPIRGRQAGDHL